MKKIIQIIKHSFLALLLIQATSCKKDYTNPNAATSDQVYSSAKGLAGIAVGLQRTYASNVSYGMSDATGLLTGETILLNAGNGSELQFVTGGNAVDGTNALLGNVWTATNKVIFDANNVILAAASLSDKGYASGLIGYATVFKALSMGCQSLYWEKVPDTVGTTASPFSDRIVGYNRAIAAIDKALVTIGANAISTAFLTDIPAGVDIVYTLNALKARYALFAGNYAQALAAANAVDMSKKSTMNFEAANPNPVYNSVTSTNNVYQPVDSTLGLPTGIQPALNDKRIPFYTLINATINPRFRLNGFWIGATTPIPIYIPDEMRLIKAECYVRQTVPNLAQAKVEIDAILMQTPAQDPFGVGADIVTGYTGIIDAPSLLTEIYRNRCIELYLSGLKLEDMRRFGRPLAERKRNLLPYPFRERDGNSNTPPDPSF